MECKTKTTEWTFKFDLTLREAARYKQATVAAEETSSYYGKSVISNAERASHANLADDNDVDGDPLNLFAAVNKKCKEYTH